MVAVSALVEVVKTYIVPQMRSELTAALNEQIKHSIKDLVAEEVRQQLAAVFAEFVYDEATKDIECPS